MKRRLALAGACAGLLAGCGPAVPPPARPPWPALAVRDLDGRALTLSATGGRPLVVNFWALWCPPCRAELPALARLAGVLARERIAVAALALADDVFAVREYLAQHAAGLRGAVLDPKLPVVREELALDALPQTFAIGADGRISVCWVGARDWDAPDVRAELARALRGG